MSESAPAFSDRWDGKTLFRALEDAARSYGEREAYVFEDGRRTYREVVTGATAVARALLAAGVRRGERIAIMLAGYADWPDLYFGAARIGVVIVAINTRYKVDEFDYAMRASEAVALFFRSDDSRGRAYEPILLEFAAYPETARKRYPALRTIIDLAAPAEIPVSFATFLDGAIDESAADLDAATSAVTAEDVALVVFTSGTTASPKGAQLVHSGILRGATYNGEVLRLTPHDRFFSAQPFFHSGGSVQVMLTPIVLGCTVVVQRYFAAGEALATMELEGCTALIGHQPHWIEYLNHPSLAARKLVLTKAYILATPEVNRMASEAFGITLICPYGLTETSLGGTGCDFDDPEELRITSVGKAHPGMELQIRDADTDAVLGPGLTGEILFRGWGIMKGYLNDPERTAATIDAKGWLRTGDSGELDESGYLRLRNRIKDMIRVGGENVAAVEVEDLLLRHPAVKLAAVVAKRDLRLGEVCLAFVERKASASVTAAELIEFCGKHLARFKVPREIRFIDAWPISGAGKIEKVKLRALVEASETSPVEEPVLRVTVDRRGVATVELHRPKSGNALSTELVAKLIETLRSAGADPAIRVVVLRGAGRHFCVGADIPRTATPAAPVGEQNDSAASLATLLDVIAALSKPTIAVVTGGCIGAGLALAGACDVLLASDGAFFSIPEVRLGISPHDIVTSVVGRAMGARNLRRYALTGERIDAPEALRIGLAHQLCADIESGVAATIDALLHGAPGATASLKAALSEQALEATQSHVVAGTGAPSLEDLLQSPEAIEGIASFREKRKPAWYPQHERD